MTSREVEDAYWAEFDRALADEERRLARLKAQATGIPIIVEDGEIVP